MERKGANIFIVSLMTVFIISLFINTLYFMALSPIMMVMIIREMKKRHDYKTGLGDIIILLLCLAEIIGLFFTDYYPNSVKASSVICCGALLWFSFRILLKDHFTIEALISLISIIVGILALITVLKYYKHKAQFIDVDFSDMTMVKQHFRPFGFALNDWVAVLICSLPFPFYKALNNKRHIGLYVLHLLSFIIVNIAVLVSFSRSGYIALAMFYFIAFLLTYLFGKENIKSVIIVSLLGLSITLVVLIPERVSILQTISMNATTSQQRSTEGRTKKWAEAIELFKQSPIVGTGSGNYEISSRLYGAKKYNSLSYRSTNTPLQILVEKGSVGAGVYLLAFVLACICLYRSLRCNKIVIPFVASLFALCLRELFFNSLFDNKIFVFVIMIFFMANLPVIQNEK